MKRLCSLLLAGALTAQAIAGPVVDHISRHAPRWTGFLGSISVNPHLDISLYRPPSIYIASGPVTTYLRVVKQGRTIILAVDAESNEIFDGKDFVKTLEGEEENTYLPGSGRGRMIFESLYDQVRFAAGLSEPQPSRNEESRSSGGYASPRLAYLRCESKSSFLF